MIKENKLSNFKGILNNIVMNDIANFIKSKKNVNNFSFENDIVWCDYQKKAYLREFYMDINVNCIDYVIRGYIDDLGRIEYTMLIPQRNDMCVILSTIFDKNDFKFANDK